MRLTINKGSKHHPAITLASLSVLLSLVMVQPVRAQTGFDAGLVLEDYVLALGSWNDGLADFTLGNQATARAYFLLEGREWNLSIRGRLDLPMSILDLDDSQFVTDLQLQPMDGDLESLVVSGNLSRPNAVYQRLGLRFGRFVMSDSSRMVFSHALDGLSASFQGNQFGLGLYAGYSGLLNKSSSKLHFSPSDQADKLNSGNFFAPPRLVAGLASRMSNDDSSLSYSTDIVYHLDLRNLVSPERLIPEGALAATGAQDGGLYSTVHLVYQFSASFGSKIHADLISIAQTGQSMIRTTEYSYATILAGAAIGSLTVFPGTYQRLSLSGGWSSGDGESRSSWAEGSAFDQPQDYIHLFKSLSSPPLGMVFKPQLGNLAWADIQWSGRPFGASRRSMLSELQASFRGLGFLRTRHGPISDARALAGSTNPYLGSEFNLGLSFRPLSDLGFGISGGMFLPAVFAGGAFENTAEPAEFMVTGFVSLRF
jgi:hypothetical protein